MATTSRSNIRAKRRSLPINSIQSRSDRSSINPRRPSQQFLSSPRQRVRGRKKTSITLPTSKNGRIEVNALTQQANSQQLSSLPRVSSSQTTTPWWLLRLYALYRYSCISTFLLVIAVLVVYGWTVYSQKLWGQSYRKLQELQRDERQLTKTNEVLKNKMAQEAEKPNTGLSSPAPNQAIFLPTEQSELNQNPTTNTIQPQNQPVQPSSLGY